MAYIKFKELTKYFYFNREIEIDNLPKYVTDYLDKDEKVFKAYETKNDKSIFTNKSMILFDNFALTKKIHTIPYKNISTISIFFSLNVATIFLVLDSGYQMRLKFINLNPESKTRLRMLYSYMVNSIK